MRRDILLNIDIAKPPVFNREFSVKNGDSLFLNVCMFQYNRPLILEDQKIRVYVRKSNGSLLMQGEDIDIISENEFQVKLKNSATNVSGLCYMEIEFQDQNEASVVVATNPILFEVEDRVGDVEDAIKAVDDLYLVGEIEKFIIEAKADIEILKQEIAEGKIKIDEFNEFIITKSEELQGAIDIALNDIDALGRHYTNHIKESGTSYLDNITTLSEGYGHKMEKLGEEFLLAISMKCDEIINYIRNEHQSSMDDITTLKEGAITEISDVKTNALFEIRTLGEDAINSIADTKSEAVLAVRDTGANEMLGLKREGLIQRNSVVKAGEDKKAELEAKATEEIARIEEKADEKIERIENIITSAEEMLSTLDAKSTEGKELSDALIALVETCRALQEQLEAENNEANSNIEELTTLHPEADVRIETLRALIEEARRYEEVVKTWIADREPAMNLDEVNAQLEELYNAVEAIIAMFDNYYTKEEVDNAINSIEIPTIEHLATKEELDNAVNSIEIPTIEHLATKEETDQLITDAIINALEDVGVILEDYATKESVNEQIQKVQEQLDELFEVGYIKDVVVTKWDTPTHGIWDVQLKAPANTINTLKCAITSGSGTKYQYTVFFATDVSNKMKIETMSNGKQRFRLDNYSSSKFEAYSVTTSTTKWSTANSAQLDYIFNAGRNDYTIEQIFYHDFDIYDFVTGDVVRESYNKQGEKNVENNFDNAVICKTYEVVQGEKKLSNSPVDGKFDGVMTVEKTDKYIVQKLLTTSGEEYKRTCKDDTWSTWSSKINKFDYTNADGMIESYNWFNIGALKVMYINVKMSEAEYNSGTNGAMMKTLNIPQEAQIFNNIFMANITSYNRDNDTSTLSRVVQNAEILSNTSVRGRWRHTDNNPPKIDRFTLMLFGF
ncbi:MAG: hypothetical protein MSA15_21435 [Clostridium sp.]|nr:hypothetical protein [Clostridium sp.]